MSLRATTYVLHRRYGSQIRKLLMIAIADYANEQGEAWPAIDTLADRAECSRRSVQEHLAALEAAGELFVIPNAGPRGTNVYRIHFKKTEARLVGDAGTAEGVQQLHGGVQMSGAQTAGGGANGVRPAAPEPSGTVREPLGTHSPQPPPAGGGERGRAAGEEELIGRLKSLRPEWAASPLLAARERREFARCRAVLEDFAGDDWALLREFLAARLAEGSAWWQPRLLRKFLENPGEVLGHAREWRRKNRKAAGPKLQVLPRPPSEPLTSEEIRQILRGRG
jgi:hypothetical protein